MCAATDADLTAASRIRNAAMTLFAERGFAGVSIRDVAAAAGVSSSLVVHHFGTKAELKSAVDARAAAVFADVLMQAVGRASGDAPARAGIGEGLIDLLGGEMAIMSYLRRMLIDGGEMAEALFNGLLTAVEEDLDELVARGVVYPSEHPRWRAAFLLVNDLAVIVLEDLLSASLGESPLTAQGMQRWTAVLMQTYTQGVFTNRPTNPDSRRDGRS